MHIVKADNLFSFTNGEQGQFSNWWELSGGGDASQAGANAVAGAFYDELSGDVDFMANFPATISLTGWRASVINSTDGTVITTAEGGSPVPGTGASGTAMPNQLATTVTLRSDLAGRSHRGRFYLPPLQFGAVTTLGRLDTDTAAAMLTSLQNAYTAGQDATGVWAAVIYSRKLHTTTAVVRVEIGDVFDTQRRRRDKLIEVRQSVTII